MREPGNLVGRDLLRWLIITPVEVFFVKVAHSIGNVTISTTSMSYVESNSASLFCNVTGNPKPFITWKTPSAGYVQPYKNDRLKVHRGNVFHNRQITKFWQAHINGTLQVDNLRKSDNGEYICYPRLAKRTDTASKPLTIRVSRGLKPTITYSMNEIQVHQLGYVPLTCRRALPVLSFCGITPQVRYYLMMGLIRIAISLVCTTRLRFHDLTSQNCSTSLTRNLLFMLLGLRRLWFDPTLPGERKSSTKDRMVPAQIHAIVESQEFHISQIRRKRQRRRIDSPRLQWKRHGIVEMQSHQHTGWNAAFVTAKFLETQTQFLLQDLMQRTSKYSTSRAVIASC